MWLPKQLIDEVDLYKEKYGFPTRTAAIIELLWRALKADREIEKSQDK